MKFGNWIAISLAAAMAVGLAAPANAAPAAGNAVAGQQAFKMQCMMCHSVTPAARPGAAPNLFGIAGRPAASTTFATYSAALKKAKITWTADNLDRFLKSPNKMVPGTRMIVSVADDTKRQNVVAYLMSLKK